MKRIIPFLVCLSLSAVAVPVVEAHVKESPHGLEQIISQKAAAFTDAIELQIVNYTATEVAVIDGEGSGPAECTDELVLLPPATGKDESLSNRWRAIKASHCKNSCHVNDYAFRNHFNASAGGLPYMRASIRSFYHSSLKK